jgi:hypothetical protein
MTTRVKIVVGILIGLLLIATGSAFYFWYKKPTGSTTTYIKVPEIKEVIKIKRVEVPGPERVVTIEKKVIVEKLNLPSWFKDNIDEQAIATAVIESYKGKTNTVATLNTKTGVGQIIAKQDPLPLLGFLNDKEVGVRAGINIKGEMVTSLYGQWDFARVGNFKIGVYADADSLGQSKAQVSVGFRF